MRWIQQTVRADAIRTHARFQRRAAVDDRRLAQMAEAGRACCNAAFCPHRYEPVEAWEGAIDDEAPSLYVLAGHHRIALARIGDVADPEARVATGAAVAWADRSAARSNARTLPYSPIEEAAIYREM